MVRILLGRMYSLIVLLFLGLLIWAYSPHVRADETFTFVVKKQEEKARTRWSLSEWLDTRDRMRMMDLWLALHSPSPYEFMLGAAYMNDRQFRFSGAAYASIFGLGGEFVSSSDWNAQFLFRIFGAHAQSTNITLHAGVETRAPDERGALAGVSMNLYLTKFFGLEGLYRHSFESVPNASGSRSFGARYEGGAFIDFNFLRIFGSYFSVERTVSGAVPQAADTGFQLGSKLYF